jgi:hypothetical protein
MAKPETRAFIHSLRSEPARVQSAISTVLVGEAGSIPLNESDAVYKGLGYTINHFESREVTPRWMNSRGLYAVVGEISSSPVWEKLLSGEEQPVEKRLSTEYRSAHVPTGIAISNAPFLTSAVSLGLLAAATGNDVSACIDDDRPPLNTNYALEIGAKYQIPAIDTEDFMSRVDELIPNPEIDPGNKEGTLISYFITNDTFRRSGGTCPAIFLTQLMLEEWGQHLHNDKVYRERFKTAITN